jgi:hypothetical protein
MFKRILCLFGPIEIVALAMFVVTIGVWAIAIGEVRCNVELASKVRFESTKP